MPVDARFYEKQLERIERREAKRVAAPVKMRKEQVLKKKGGRHG